MIIFKTRHELRELRKAVEQHNDIMNALRAHFDLKYTMKDFEDYWERLMSDPDIKFDHIPVSVGEFLHMFEMLSPLKRTAYFRGIEVKPEDNRDNHLKSTETT